MPRWVKVFVWVGAVLLVAFAVVHLTGHGLGGHGMHGAHSPEHGSP